MIIGNGGAPLTASNASYGYGVFSQRSDGAIVVDVINAQTKLADGSFHFAVTATGAAAAP